MSTFSVLCRLLRQHQPGADPEPLYKQAQKLGERYKGADLDHALTMELTHAVKVFDPQKGWTFGQLLMTNLKTRLRRDHARGNEAKQKEEDGLELYVEWLRGLVPTDAQCLRWESILFEAAVWFSHATTRQYVEARRAGANTQKEIAAAIGVSEARLSERFGRDRMVEILRKAVAGVVGRLTATQFGFLVRAMDDDGLTDADIARLLMTDPDTLSLYQKGPVLGDEALAKALGWPEKIFFENRLSKGQFW